MRPPPILSLFPYTTLFRSGLYGWAMSRFCGTWVALKSMHETVESTAVIDGSMERVNIIVPDDFAMPDGGRSEEHTSELQSLTNLVCRLLLEKNNASR